MASIYILFPKEHPDLLQSAIQHFQWSVERFEAMSERNSLAKAALSVLQAIYVRLKKSLGIGFVVKTPMTSSEAANEISPSNIDPSLTNGSADGNGDSISGPSTLETPGSHSVSTINTTPGDSYSSSGVATASTQDGVEQPPQPTLDFSFPSNFDWSSIAPMYPMGDLAYGDLMGIGNDGSVPTWAASTPELATSGQQVPLQFEGDFNDNSLWGLLNQYTAY